MQNNPQLLKRGQNMKSFCVITVSLSLLAVASAASLNASCVLKEFIPTYDRIISQGYPAESHFVETGDGYLLNLFRIPYSPKLQNQYVKRPAVLLQHGLLSNSDCWLATGVDYALAYILSDAGFDVWLGNARGNTYSRYNTRMSTNSPSFWRFDWHEIGTIDIPTMIDHILRVTGEKQIHYAGHSQGTTVYFVMMSERPEYNTKIKSAHMLAPCAFLEHGSSDVYNFFRALLGKPGSTWNMLLKDTEFFPRNTLLASISNTACGGTDPALQIICKNMWIAFAGDDYTNTNLTALQILLETHPGGCSSNQGIHFALLSDYNKGRFCRMDYGPKRNIILYGQETAPDYNLENIKAATYLYSGPKDGLCNPKDVDTLVANTPHLAGDYRVPLETFSHLDFVIGNNMKQMVNDRVVENVFKHEDSL